MYSLTKKIYKNGFYLLSFLPLRLLTMNSFIPIIESPKGKDGVIRKGKFRGRNCYYKVGLLNTLIKLKPKLCLEIGTHLGGTAKIFEYYFKKYRPDGILITCDIKCYIKLNSKYIRQVIVYPHINNIEDYHKVTKNELLPAYEDHLENSVKANCEIIKKELSKIRASSFDFYFIDGDHTRISFLKDIEIAKALSTPPHYILLDDTKEEDHECCFVYQNELKLKFNHYDFDDWLIFVSMSLIWDKNYPYK